jgi:drug/metabolite transporter (DMT)-like permease
MADPAQCGGGRGAAAGSVYILLSAVCFGWLPIFARYAFQAGVDVPTLLVLRFGISAACMWILLAWKGVPLPRGRSLALLLVMGGVLYTGQAWCYFTAITLASVWLVSLLFNLYPAIVTVLSRVVFHHPLTRLQVVAVAIALAGSMLTVGRAGGGKPLGIVLALLATLCYSTFILAGTRIPAAVSPIATSTVITTVAAAVYAGAAALHGLRLPATGAGWAGVLGVAVVCGTLATLLFFKGLEQVGPVRASVYSTVELAVTLGLAAVVLGESLNLVRAAGAVLIVTAVVLLAQQELRSNPGAAAARRPALRPPAPAAPPPTAEA